VIWRAIQSAVGLFVTPIQTSSRATKTNDDEAVEQVECKRRHDEQIHRCDLWHMLAQKRPPALARRSVVLLNHVFRDSGLSDPKPSFRSSPWMRGAHQSGFSRLICLISAHRSVSTCGAPSPISGLPSPVAAKTRPMSANQRVRAKDLNDLQYRRKPAVQLDEKQPVAVCQPNLSPTLVTCAGAPHSRPEAPRSI